MLLKPQIRKNLDRASINVEGVDHKGLRLKTIPSVKMVNRSNKAVKRVLS